MSDAGKREFTEHEQRRRDDLLLKLLKTPPDQRPKRERPKPERADKK